MKFTLVIQQKLEVTGVYRFDRIWNGPDTFFLINPGQAKWKFSNRPNQTKAYNIFIKTTIHKITIEYKYIVIFNLHNKQNNNRIWKKLSNWKRSRSKTHNLPSKHLMHLCRSLAVKIQLVAESLRIVPIFQQSNSC